MQIPNIPTVTHQIKWHIPTKLSQRFHLFSREEESNNNYSQYIRVWGDSDIQSLSKHKWQDIVERKCTIIGRGRCRSRGIGLSHSKDEGENNQNHERSFAQLHLVIFQELYFLGFSFYYRSFFVVVKKSKCGGLSTASFLT